MNPICARFVHQPAIIAGLLSGRAFIDLEGTADRVIDLTVSGPTGQAQMGDTFSATRNARLTVRISTASAPPGASLELWDGAERLALPAGTSAAQAEVHLRMAPGNHALRPALRAAGGTCC